MKIESADQDIRTLLTSGYYRIPRFQRPFSWDKENVEEFWDDVVRDNPTDYFIGSMVVFRLANQNFGVVDGQQRLTTITILLCVLRNKLAELGYEDLSKGIHNLIERKNIDNRSEFVLTPETSHPYFQDNIQKFGKSDLNTSPLQEEKNIKLVFNQFNKLLENIITNIKTSPILKNEDIDLLIKEEMIKIRDSLLNLKIILIKLDDEDDAYIIFETLNSRGKDLNLSDLVKNHLTKHLKAKNSSLDSPKIKWDKLSKIIQESSVDISIDTFIHHYWLSKYEYITAKKLFKQLKKRITQKKSTDFLDNLLANSGLYRSIHEVEYGKWSKQEIEISNYLESLMLFNVKQQTPCVLSLVRAYRNKKIKTKLLKESLRAIAYFHFLFTAVTSQRSSGGISTMYASFGRRISEALDTHEVATVISEIKQKLRNKIPSLDETIALFPEMIYTENFTKQRHLIKYTLVGLAKGNKNDTSIDYPNLTIEHLVPQNLIGNGEYTDEVIGQIGNMILVSSELNSKLSTKTFKEKKKILIKEGYDLFPEVFNMPDNVTPKDILNRSKSLAEQAHTSAWKI